MEDKCGGEGVTVGEEGGSLGSSEACASGEVGEGVRGGSRQQRGRKGRGRRKKTSGSVKSTASQDTHSESAEECGPMITETSLKQSFNPRKCGHDTHGSSSPSASEATSTVNEDDELTTVAAERVHNEQSVNETVSTPTESVYNTDDTLPSNDLQSSPSPPLQTTSPTDERTTSKRRYTYSVSPERPTPMEVTTDENTPPLPGDITAPTTTSTPPPLPGGSQRKRRRTHSVSPSSSLLLSGAISIDTGTTGAGAPETSEMSSGSTRTTQKM